MAATRTTYPGSPGASRWRNAALVIVVFAAAASGSAGSAVPLLPVTAAAEPIEGEWIGDVRQDTRVYRVESTGPRTFRGVIVQSEDPCFPVGMVQWQISGTGTSYTGTTQWVDTTTCRPTGLGSSTWTFEAGQLRWQTTNPTNSADVRVSLLRRNGGTPEKPLLDVGLPTQPDAFPLAGTSSLSVNVQQNGTVVARPGGAGAGAAIRCGVAGSACFDRVDTGARLRLSAKAAPGYLFTGWHNGCSGRTATCTVTVSGSRTVSASFAPKAGAASVAASLARPRVRVKWRASIGSGQLVVRGRVTRPARLRLELRRPGGGPLLVRRLSVPAGPFRSVTKLHPRSLARGARLFPGGFIVVLRGRSGALEVPLQVQTVVLGAPAEGVVRRAYASTSQTGRPLPIPPRPKEVWARFVLEAQPKAALKPTVSWFNPAGGLVGTVPKPNRPDILTFARSDAGLGSGLWRVELRAGGRLVKTLSIKIG